MPQTITGGKSSTPYRDRSPCHKSYFLCESETVLRHASAISSYVPPLARFSHHGQHTYKEFPKPAIRFCYDKKNHPGCWDTARLPHKDKPENFPPSSHSVPGWLYPTRLPVHSTSPPLFEQAGIPNTPDRDNRYSTPVSRPKNAY